MGRRRWWVSRYGLGWIRCDSAQLWRPTSFRVLTIIPIFHHAAKTFEGDGIAPWTLNLGARWIWVVSFTLLSLYPQEIDPVPMVWGCELERKMSGFCLASNEEIRFLFGIWYFIDIIENLCWCTNLHIHIYTYLYYLYSYIYIYGGFIWSLVGDYS
jgi:hypothetical protein